MTAFFNALQQGYTPQQVLSYLSQAIPQFSPVIKKAQRAGYPAQQILGFLSKNFDTENRQGMSESQRHAANRRADAERTKYGLQVAGAAIATPLAARAAQGVLARALPQSLAGGIAQSPVPKTTINPGASYPSNTGSAPNQGTFQTGTPQQQASSSQPPVSPNLPQASPQIQPETKPLQLKDVLNKYGGFESKVNELLKTKNPPEAIAAYFKKFNAGQTAKLEKEVGKPIEEIIAEYASTIPQEETDRILSKEEALGAFRNRQMIKHAMEEGNAVEEPVKQLDIEEAKPIAKGATVISPQGVAEVKEIRNGKALIEVDGKKHVVDEDELEKEPEDLEDAVRHILDSIPEKQKSSAFESSIHITLPTGQNLMVTKFYNGKWAWYLDVPENLYEDIATGVYSPKTSGKTGIAEYKPGVVDSRGAGFQSEIVQNPKYGKKEKGITWGYANSKYNALEMIQETINKISKEKYDEEGNLIKSKKRKKPS